MSKALHTVFISYANPDQNRVIPFYDYLKDNGFDVWMDKYNILPGQNWDLEIKRSISRSRFFIVFVSKNSVDRRGYFQREVSIAIDKKTENLIDDIDIIPVLLDDDIYIPDQLKAIQCISASDNSCKQKICTSLNHQLEKFGYQENKTKKIGDFSWEKVDFSESWDGIPGYDIQAEFINVYSEQNKNLQEIGQYIKGKILEKIFLYRSAKISQDSSFYNYMQDKWLRTDTFYASCSDPSIIGKMLSIRYEINYYESGAAHPNSYFMTFNFLIDPVMLVESISAIFENKDEASSVIQEKIRNDIRKSKLENNEEEYINWELFNEGTADWDHFGHFIFHDDRVHFLFPPYQIDCYAAGAQIASIPLKEISYLIKQKYKIALDLPLW